ncbi:MAG TPA: hypothetical protein ENI74_03685 [Gammaproteobacteria bacterium]|nr:hypothetical protein [Gammaproteobacteria bacterium]
MIQNTTTVAVSRYLCGILLMVSTVIPVQANDIEKVLFLVVEKDEIVASNTLAGRFDRLNLHAKERVRDYKVSNAVAVVVTNQRLVGYGVLAGGWQGTRLEAREKVQQIEVQDYSATVVTNDRILNFYGRSGAWSHTRRRVQLR